MVAKIKQKDTKGTKASPVTWIQGRRCETHHHACDCRESYLAAVAKLAARELRRVGLAGDEEAFTAYVELNEMWLALYGHEILKDAKA